MDSDLTTKLFTIGTRSSDLAMVQTYEVMDLLITAANKQGIMIGKDNFKIQEIHHSLGDTDQKLQLYKLGGTGVFCKQLEIELLEKNCDIGVHSMKDLPTAVTKGLIVPAIPGLKPRDDVVILKQEFKNIKDLSELPDGSIIGTSSLRRIWTLQRKFPKLKIENIRGNLNTRLRKLEEEDYAAIILARAGVERLGWADKIDQVLDKNEFQYAPAQGSLAVQWRDDDLDTLTLLKLIDNPFSRRIIEAERIYLRTLEGGCTLPISVNAQVFHKDDLNTEITSYPEEGNTQNYNIKLSGTVYDKNNHDNYLEHCVSGDLDDWIELGTKLANELRDQGATEYVGNTIYEEKKD